MEPLRPLLGRTLVLVAHPDDEAVGCGILLQRIRHATVVFATNGAPQSDFFWSSYGSRENYAAVRAGEARNALHTVGVKDIHHLGSFGDQELHSHLNAAYEELCDVLEHTRSEAILTLAYEGGHPDHDCCAFLGSELAADYGLPVWEMPLYHRTERGETQRQTFLAQVGGEKSIHANETELACKLEMFRKYRSQAKVLREFSAGIECVRPLAAYDFSRPPHSGQLNYEAWQWPVSGADLCAAFQRFKQSKSTGSQKWRQTA